MLGEYAAKKVLDAVIERLKGYGRAQEKRLQADLSSLEAALQHHFNTAANWSQEISFKDLAEPKNLASVYVELDVLLTPRRLHVAEEERALKKPFLQVVRDQAKHLVLLGPPGSGKTTSLKRVCLSFMIDDEFTRRFDIPIIVRLREIQTAAPYPLLMELAGLVGIRFNFLESDDESYRAATIERSVCACIEEINALLLIDGFDELLPELRPNVAADLSRLALALTNSFLIVTSRSADFQISLPNSQVFEIAPMSDDQVATFCREYLGQLDSTTFLSLLKSSPYFDARINPLHLGYLCAIFERLGRIPDKPRTVYRKLINLGLEEWDEQKPVKRSSKYANFDVDRKKDFLARLAFELTTRRGGASFSREDLYTVFLDDLHDQFDLDPAEAEKVVDELETYTGLFCKVGQERYEFSHKSLQEYLAAEYIVGLPKVETSFKIICRIPNELAVAVAISSDADFFFDVIVREALLGNLDPWEEEPGRFEFEGVNLDEKEPGLISYEIVGKKIFRKADPSTVEANLSNLTKERFAEPIAVRMICDVFISQFLSRLQAERVDFSGTPPLAVGCLWLYTVLSRYKKYESVQRALITLRAFVDDMPAIQKSLRRLSWHYDLTRSARHKSLIFVRRPNSRIEGPDLLLCEEAFIKDG